MSDVASVPYVPVFTGCAAAQQTWDAITRTSLLLTSIPNPNSTPNRWKQSH